MDEGFCVLFWDTGRCYSGTPPHQSVLISPLTLARDYAWRASYHYLEHGSSQSVVSEGSNAPGTGWLAAWGVHLVSSRYKLMI